MDTLTHIVLGAAIGEVLAGRKLGKNALLFGAAANSLPDIDFVASFWLPTARDVWAHRGLTHSFLFLAFMTPVLAFLAARALPRSGMTRRDWWLFFGVEIFAHLFIDAFNAYGTGWFEPFNHYRVSFHVLFVADPFFSVWLAISFAALLILRRNHPARRKWAWAGLLLSTAYLCYCITNKLRIDDHARADLQAQHHTYTRYFSTPTPLNNWLWYIVAEDSGGFYTGYRSMFDHKPTQFRFQPKAKRLLKPYLEHPDVHYLMRFCQGFYTVEEWGDTVVFNDLRFGEMKGWEDPKARFVFHYYLQRPDENEIIVQRGRFAGWDRHSLRIFIRRIRGN
ncbi:metal-dependent hydrolase [Puia sp.]|jgi:inner membrane protein|uniref:metal-dependent hydrolase n=1 Tax=Puia sp. TaxID=2045100 RepID=UPI002F425010